MNSWHSYLDYIENEAIKLNSSFLFLPIPEKHTIYSDKLPDGVSFVPPSPLEELECHLSDTAYMLSVRDLFLRSRHCFDLYLKKDSHWSPCGAFLACKILCDNLNINYGIDNRHLYVDCTPKDYFYPWTDCLSKLNRAFLSDKIKKQRIGERGRIGDISYIKNNGVHSGRICLFGNSFSEYYFSNLISKSFREVFFLFSPHVDMDLVKEIRPDCIVFQTNERFLSINPSYLSDISFVTHLIRRGISQSLCKSIMEFEADLGGSVEILKHIITNEKDIVKADIAKLKNKTGDLSYVSRMIYTFDQLNQTSWLDDMKLSVDSNEKKNLKNGLELLFIQEQIDSIF